MHLKPLFSFLLCFFAIFLFFEASAFGFQMTLDEAVSHALDYNISLRKNEIDLTTSEYSEKNIWSEIFPTINATASAGYRNTLFSNVPMNNSGVNYSIGLGVNLGLNAGIPYAMRNIRLAHQGNILRHEDAKNQLSIQVTKFYYSLVAEKNNLLLLEEIFNLAERQHTRSDVAFRNGLVGELSLTQSRLAMENARYNLSASRISHRNNMADFLAMLGLSYDENISLLGDVSIIKIEADAEPLINEYLTHRPDITRMKQEIERLENLQVQTSMQTRAPSLNLSLDWNSSAFDPFADVFSATARLNIPIDPWIPGTSRSQNITRAQSAVEKAKMDLYITENSATTQIRSLCALLRNSWDSISIAKLSLEAAQRSYQLTELGYQNGTVELLTLQDARNNMANARQRLLQTELSYFNMILDLSSALNIEWKNLIHTYGVQNEES